MVRRGSAARDGAFCIEHCWVCGDCPNHGQGRPLEPSAACDRTRRAAGAEGHRPVGFPGAPLFSKVASRLGQVQAPPRPAFSPEEISAVPPQMWFCFWLSILMQEVQDFHSARKE